MAKWIGKKGDESFIIFMEQVANKSYSIAVVPGEGVNQLPLLLTYENADL